MAITTRDGLVAAMATQQLITQAKTASRTSVASNWFSVFDLAGNPGAGVLAGANTANGVVPTDATAGCPAINAFGGGNTGYLTGVKYGSSVASRLRLYDMLFKAGAYAFNANVALTAQPSYAARAPSYRGTEIWIEAVTAFTGNLSVRVQYLDEGGAAGDTGTIALGVAPTVGRMFQLPLAAGDSGVSQITNVTGTVSTAGTFNVLVLRRLWSGRVPVANGGGTDGPDQVGLVQVFDTSALIALVNADSTSTGLPDLDFFIANG